MDKGEVGCEGPPGWGLTQLTDAVVIDELIVGPLMTSYGDNGEVETATSGGTKTSDAKASMRNYIDGRLNGRDVNDGWCGESSHDNARQDRVVR